MAPPEAGKPPTRRQLAAQETRQKLLRAALENFSRRPYGEVTVGDIARTAGVAHGLLSHHFKGKESLYAEAVREVDQQLRTATEFASEGPVVDRLRRHFTAHLVFLSEHEDIALNLILRRAQGGRRGGGGGGGGGGGWGGGARPGGGGDAATHPPPHPP
ncbi:TetR/AcrR family transcriptional regulator, partial [Streptomyces hirsutus]|uniref:TetR/AcrR family transcriptional regulator n=1 Tax=Streptomyces hirsutus TaxID=35620 RepID=UPI00366831F3